MNIITSKTLENKSRFHRSFVMILALFDLDWKDVGVCQEWSAEEIANKLETIVSDEKNSENQIGTCRERQIPLNIQEQILNIASHPHFGFPLSLMEPIRAYFCNSSKNGWSNAKILTASSGIILARHFFQNS